ncbi:MAG: hypothetical protein KGZ30_01600 [Anaplasmataceae bacterium]|nr:hypothetical protein [Anaplasmataceae bacterium]
MIKINWPDFLGGSWLLLTLWAWGPDKENLFFWSVLVVGVFLVIISVWPEKKPNLRQGRLE